MKTPDSKSADHAGSTVHVPLPQPDGSDERPTETGPPTLPSAPTPPTSPAMPTDVSQGATTEGSSIDTVTPSITGIGGTIADATSSDTLMKSITELIKVQMKAMTKAASVQSLLPLDRYSGEGSRAENDGTDRWLE